MLYLNLDKEVAIRWLKTADEDGKVLARRKTHDYEGYEELSFYYLSESDKLKHMDKMESLGYTTAQAGSSVLYEDAERGKDFKPESFGDIVKYRSLCEVRYPSATYYKYVKPEYLNEESKDYNKDPIDRSHEMSNEAINELVELGYLNPENLSDIEERPTFNLYIKDELLESDKELIINSLDFEIIKEGENYRIKDIQGANLSNVENETFESLDDILDRLNVYLFDYLIAIVSNDEYEKLIEM